MCGELRPNRKLRIVVSVRRALQTVFSSRSGSRSGAASAPAPSQAALLRRFVAGLGLAAVLIVSVGITAGPALASTTPVTPAPSATPSAAPFATASAAPTAPAPSPDPASISGTVRDSAGNPIQDVFVSANPNPCCSDGYGSATTASDGRYTLEGLAAGSYTLDFSKTDSPYVSMSFGASGSASDPTVLTVAPGDVLTGKDVTLATGASISGVVSDESGNAIEGVAVYSIASGCCSAGSWAITAPDGTYRLDGLEAGSYRVQFSKSDSAYITRYFGGTGFYWSATLLTVDLGDALTGKNVVLHLGASISGVVTDSTGNPIEGVEVNANTEPCCSGYGSATTAADGSYTVDALEPGSYQVKFTKPGSPYVSQYLGGSTSSVDATVLTVAAGEAVTGNNAILVTGGSISGVVTDSTGTPVENAQVYAYGNSAGATGSTATTAPDGSYTLDGLAAGSYIVQFSKAGSSFVTQFFGGSTSQPSGTVLTVVLGDALTGKNVALVMGASISGVVRDAAGNPVEGVQINANSSPCCSGSGYAITNADGAYTVDGLAAGSYRLLFTKPDSSYVTQYLGGSTSAANATILKVALGDALTGKDTVLVAGASISGTVKDTAGNPLEAVEVFALSDPCCSNYNSVLTAADGSYRLDALPADSYKIQFSQWDSPFVTQFFGGSTSSEAATSLKVALGDALTGKDVTLFTGASISGVITDSSGNPIEGVSVTAEPSPCCSGGRGYAQTAADGSYKVQALNTGAYVLSFSKSGSQYVSRYLGGSSSSAGATVLTVILSDALTGKDAILLTGASISGVVTDPSGNPIEDIYVIADSSPCCSADGGFTQTAADGSYRLDGLAAGPYTVQFRKAGSPYASQYLGGSLSSTTATVVTVALGDAVTGKNITLVLGASISGTVTDTSGKPISDVFVTADSLPCCSDLSGAMTAEDGSYTVDGLAPGSYTLLFSKQDSSYLSRFLSNSDSPSVATVVNVVAGDALTGKDVTLSATGVSGRLSGADRFETSAAISADSFDSDVPVVYIANGYNFPDALSGAPVAGTQDGPVLLVAAESIPAVIQDELTRLNPGQIVILGGTTAVSGHVEAELKALTAGKVTRLAGSDRFETSAAISEANFEPNVPVVYIANGYNFPDALSGAPVAGAEGGPVLLVAAGSIPKAIQTELTRLHPGKIVILGGTNAVSGVVEADLASSTTGVVSRLSGADRFETSAAISEASFQPNVPVVYIANGYNFPDALSGAPVAGSQKGPVLLVPAGSIPAVIQAELTRLNPSRIVILGGMNAVSEDVSEQLMPSAK